MYRVHFRKKEGQHNYDFQKKSIGAREALTLLVQWKQSQPHIGTTELDLSESKQQLFLVVVVFVLTSGT